MTDKEFRRLSRRDLVDIIFELQNQLAASQAEAAKLKDALEHRENKLLQAGSIAEAALSLHDVFAHAQAAADQYVQEVTQVHSQAQAQADWIIAEAKQKARAILTKAKTEHDAILAAAQSQRDTLAAESKAQQDAMNYWMNL